MNGEGIDRQGFELMPLEGMTYEAAALPSLPTGSANTGIKWHVLVHNIMEIRNRWASGPVHIKHRFCYIYQINLLDTILGALVWPQ